MPHLIDTLLRLIIFAFGAFIVYSVVVAAIRTFVLPRSAFVWLTAVVFQAVLSLFRWRAKRKATYEERDHVMAMFAPVALLSLPIVWIILIIFAYTLMFWSGFNVTFYDAFSLAGSSLLTLGFTKSDGVASLLLEFSAAVFGLSMVALLIAYLPTMYAAFSKRETLVTILETRAGSPPSMLEMIARANRIGGIHVLNEYWYDWELWFAEIDETHTSLIALVFFRSPDPHRSWVTAAGVMLDSAALLISAIDVEISPDARLMIRAGFIALRHIADYFEVDYNPDPKADDPISISRYEFDELLDLMKITGIPVKPDREQAWKDFCGWRVNYDRPLLALAALTMAPYAPWVSDRSLPLTFRNTGRTPIARSLATRFARKQMQEKPLN